MLKKWTREDWYKFICNNLLIIFGCIFLAIGTAMFLTRLNIVAGGMSGIAIIIQYYVNLANPELQLIDIIVWSGSAILWIIGFIFIGKEFAFRTLLASLVYPLFLTLFLRIPFFQNIAIELAGDSSAGNIILCGLFAGVFIGSGVGLTFLGKGSTGGVDVLVFICAKHTRLKESVWSFLIDGMVIVVSMFAIPGNWINSLVGILSAFVTAMMIDFIYNSTVSSYQADIISSKWQEISRYAQDEMLRGATIIKAQGGYKGEERIILRVVFEKRQMDKFAKYIAKIDPQAFVTYTQAKAVYGEGFKEHK